MTVDYEAFTRTLLEDLRTHDGRATTGPMAGRSLMILTTKGARSGLARTAILAYTRDGARYVVAASKSGAPTHPAWYHNLDAHPEVTVEVGGTTFAGRATAASGKERDRLWELHATELPGFREYPKITDRVIPMVVIDRVD